MGNAAIYADKIAVGATAAKTDVNMLGEAFSEASSVANGYKQSADTTMVSLLRLAQANVTGSEAATMLSRVMADLYTPTGEASKALDELGVSAYDQSGNARDLTDVINDLTAATAGMSDEQKNAYLDTIFTTNGLKGYNMMLATSEEKTASFYNTMANSGGAAATQAQTQLDNLEGDITLLKSALEGLAISFGEILVPVIRKLVTFLQKIVDWLNGLAPWQKKLIVIIAAVVAAIGPILLIVGGIITGIGQFLLFAPLAVTMITTTILPAIASVMAALAPFLIGGAIIVGIIIAVVFLVKFIRNHWEEIKAGVEKAVDTIRSLFEKARDFIQSILEFIHDLFANFVKNAFNWGADLIANFINGIKSMLTRLWDTVKNVAQGIRDYIGFSEPEKGPLSNFHTYAPDMMKLFAQGLKESEWMLQRQMASSLTPPDLSVAPVQSGGQAGGNMPNVIPTGAGRGEIRQQTVILQLDRTQFGRLVYDLNEERTRQIGVNLAGGSA